MSTILAFFLFWIPGCGPAGQKASPDTSRSPEPKTEAADRKLLTPQDIKWTAAPPPLPPGTQFVLLQGDASKPERFATRVLLPDGARFEPHTHPEVSHVTVLQGTLYLGFGDKFDAETAKAYPAGSFLVEPADVPHFAFVKGDTILHIEAVGPFGLDYLVGDGSTGTPAQ